MGQTASHLAWAWAGACIFQRGVPAGATLAVGDAAVSCRTPCGLYRRLHLETTGTYQLQEPQGAGCLCGSVRLRLQEPPIRLMHCHCSMCRRQGGGAFMTWAAYPDSAIEVLQGRRALRRFNSSDFANRTFCPKCGSTIALNYHGQLGTTWLAAGMIDGDIGCCPDSHIMLNYKAPWWLIPTRRQRAECAALLARLSGTSWLGLVYKIVSETYEPIPPQYSADLRTLLDDILEKSSSKRPSGQELIARAYVRRFDAPGQADKDAKEARTGTGSKETTEPKAAPKPPVKSSIENLKRVEPEPVQPIIEDQPVRREWHAPPFVSTPAPQHTLAEGELRVRALLSRVRRGLSARRQNWLQVFASFDRKGDGQLKEAEFERAVTSMALGLSDQEIREESTRVGAAIWSCDMFDFEAMEVNGAVGQATRRGAEDVDKDGNTALHRLLAAAAQGGSETATDPVRRMLSARADVNVSNALGETPLLSLLRATGDLNSTRALCTILLRARADPNCSDSITGESPLMEAACLGDRSLCLWLLQAQADISQCNSNGQQASDVAIAAGHSELAQLLAKGTGADERNDPTAAELGIRSSPREQQDLPQDPGATAESSVPTQRPKGRPRGRGALSGAMQKRCEEHGVPLDVLGLVASSELLKEIDRWQTLTEAELASEWEAHGMETETESMRPRDELEARLKQLRLWRLLPMEALQDACRREAGHLVTADEGPLSRQELVEALQVATWGGLTRLQRTRKRCAEKGIPDKKLENRERAEHILQEFEKLENMKEADLMRQYKGKGFAHDVDLSQDELLSALKEYVLFQEMSLSHLRQICKEKNLAIRGEHRRTELIALVTADSWQRFQIPVLKMPSTLVAQGLLDQVQRFQKKELPQLRHECRKRNLPAESHPRKQDLINRLRNHLVWSQMTTDGLREECQARGVKFQTVQVASNASHMLKMHAERAEKKEMIDALHSWLVTEMLELKGIPVKTVGHEVAMGILTEVERYESMPASLLQAEYATLGMPSEPNLDDKELLRRLKQVLIWSQLSVDELVKECEARELSSGGFPNRPSEADKIQVLMDRLILSLGVDGWEKQGIPVYRLTSLEAAIVIVEELGRLEAAKQADVSAAYRLLGLPPEALDKAAMISRLKHYLVWQELRPAELRKECLKHGISALGDPEELIALLVLKNWGVLPEDWEAPDPPDWSRFEPPPRRQSPAPAPPSAKVAAAFRELGLELSASHEQVRKAYRKLALQHHPDKNPGLHQDQAVKKFQTITSSYETVLDHMKKLSVRIFLQGASSHVPVDLFGDALHRSFPEVQHLEDWAKLLLNELAQKAMTEDDAKARDVYPGAQVRIHSLQSAMGAKLNGCEGIVETWNAATCRWNVRIAGVGVKSIRDEHLEQLNPGAFGAPKMPASSTGTDTIAIYRLLCKDGVTAVHESDFQAVVQRLLPQSEEQHKKLLWLLPKCPDGKVDVPEALSQLEKGFDQTTQLPGATLAGGVGRAPVGAGGPPVPLVPGPLNPAQGGRPRNTGLRGPGSLPSPMAPNPTSCSSKLRTRVFCQPPPCWIAFSAFSWAQALGRTNQLRLLANSDIQFCTSNTPSLNFCAVAAPYAGLTRRADMSPAHRDTLTLTKAKEQVMQLVEKAKAAVSEMRGGVGQPAAPTGGTAAGQTSNPQNGGTGRAEAALLRLSQHLLGRARAPGPGVDVLRLFARSPDVTTLEEVMEAVSVLPLGISRAEVQPIFAHIRGLGAGTLPLSQLATAAEAACAMGVPAEAAGIEQIDPKRLGPALQRLGSRASQQEFRVALMQAEPYMTHNQMEWLSELTDKDGEGRLLPSTLLPRLGLTALPNRADPLSWSNVPPRPAMNPPRRTSVAHSAPQVLVVSALLWRVRQRLFMAGSKITLGSLLGLFDLADGSSRQQAEAALVSRDLLGSLLGHLRLGISVEEADELLSAISASAGKRSGGSGTVQMALLYDMIDRAGQPEMESLVVELRETARQRLWGKGSCIMSAAGSAADDWLPEVDFRKGLKAAMADIWAVPGSLPEDDEDRLVLLAEKDAEGRVLWRPFVQAFCSWPDLDQVSEVTEARCWPLSRCWLEVLDFADANSSPPWVKGGGAACNLQAAQVDQADQAWWHPSLMQSFVEYGSIESRGVQLLPHPGPLRLGAPTRACEPPLLAGPVSLFGWVPPRVRVSLRCLLDQCLQLRELEEDVVDGVLVVVRRVLQLFECVLAEFVLLLPRVHRALSRQVGVAARHRVCTLQYDSCERCCDLVRAVRRARTGWLFAEPAGEPEEGGPPQAPARAAPPDRCRVHNHEQERVSGYTPPSEPSEHRRRRAHAAADEGEPRFRVEWKVEAVWGPASVRDTGRVQAGEVGLSEVGEREGTHSQLQWRRVHNSSGSVVPQQVYPLGQLSDQYQLSEAPSLQAKSSACLTAGTPFPS
eukprot:s1601_g21.t4